MAADFRPWKLVERRVESIASKIGDALVHLLTIAQSNENSELAQKITRARITDSVGGLIILNLRKQPDDPWSCASD